MRVESVRETRSLAYCRSNALSTDKRNSGWKSGSDVFLSGSDNFSWPQYTWHSRPRLFMRSLCPCVAYRRQPIPELRGVVIADDVSDDGLRYVIKS